MLPTRIITAIILIPLVILAIFKLSVLYFSFIMAALVLVGAWEWAGLIGFTKNIFKILYVVLVAAVILFYIDAQSVLMDEPLMEILFICVILFAATLIWIWFFIAIINYQKNGLGAGFQFRFVRFFTGFLVLISTWIAIVTLKASIYFGPAWLILVLLIIWAADVGGYFGGYFFGKKSFCSRVSPKKTWEGFWGGLILSMIVAAIGGLFLSLSIKNYFYLLLIALFTIIFSAIGDLGVSLLKRMSGVKDSGKFFPGHGGMLDRMDSVAAGTVIFVIGALLCNLL